MKYSKMLKALREHKDEIAITISDFSYMPEYPSISWQDYIADGVWGYTQEQVVEEALKLMEEYKGFWNIQQSPFLMIFSAKKDNMEYQIYYPKIKYEEE